MTEPVKPECDHKENTNLQIAQSVVDLGGKILIIISNRCSVCKDVVMLLKDVPVTMGPLTATPLPDGKIFKGKD